MGYPLALHRGSVAGAELFYVGITHRTAPLQVRERLRADVRKQRILLANFARIAHGRMILATCERFEVYAVTAVREPSDFLTRLAECFHLPIGLLAGHACTLRGRPVAEHLLRVAAGLESRIVGEPHILGQVREAYLLAADALSLDPSLSAMGRAAIHTGRRVRNETPINRTNRSIATITLDRLEYDLGSLRFRTILIAGSGRLAGDVAVGVSARGTGRVLIASRNLDRAHAIAKRTGGEVLPMSRLAQGIACSDAVITCTAAPSFIVDSASIGGNRRENLHLIDLSVPRNVDPAVGRHPRVRLVHLDRLVAQAPLHPRGLSAATRIVEEELERFMRWHRERRIAPIIARMVRNANRHNADNNPAHKRTLHSRIVRLKRKVAV